MSIISQNVKNALIELNPNIKGVILDINTDSGVSRLDVFKLGIVLGSLYTIQVESSAYDLTEDEIEENIKNVVEFLLKY